MNNNNSNNNNNIYNILEHNAKETLKKISSDDNILEEASYLEMIGWR